MFKRLFLFVTAAVLPLAAATTQIDESDAWAFQTNDDAFTAAAVDIGAMLNEPQAGQHGFIRRSADGASFVRGDGAPIRFWAVVSDGFNLSPADMELHAAWLAKRGVNMARIHANLSVATAGAKVTDVDQTTLDHILRWVAVCKKHGIYVTISPYWANAHAPASWGIDGYSDESPWGVLFFNPTLQSGYKAWVKALYTTPNPYLGNVALKDEPAVAIAQVLNEDSLLFWTFNDIKAPQKAILGAQFAEWAKAKYGSLAATQTAWSSAAADGDDWTKGVLGFRNLWELTADAPKATGGMAVRLADQLEFLTTTDRAFYAAMEQYLKNELHVQSLTNATNWRSVDQVLVDDAERFSYTPMDVSAVNYYTGGAHVGPNNGWRIDPGDKFTSGSVLRGDISLPASLKQTSGHPMLITETAWVHPNLYQSEGPFLMAAYTAMNGVDATYWFAFGSTAQWQKDARWDYFPGAGQKWFGAYPMQAGQFPALAFAFRQGYITAATQPAVYEERALQDIWTGKVPIISEAGRFDPNRDAGVFAPDSPIRQEVDRQAFYVGPVVAKYEGDAKNNKVVDLTQYINATTGDVRSLTGELNLNTKLGYASIDATRIQGVCGFLKQAGGTFKLGATTWQTTNEYASFVAVSLDGAPLKTSRRVLVQAGTLSRMKGFTTQPTTITDNGKTVAGDEVVSNGAPPWLVVNTHATLTLANPSLDKATVLDPNLYKLRDGNVTIDGGHATVTLPPDALYLLLEATGQATAPTISEQPRSQTAAAGSSVSLHVGATGSTDLTYQWSHDGAAIAGATDATYTVPSLGAADEGDYTVTVTNSLGSATSVFARVTLPASNAAFLANLSVRAKLAANHILITGLGVAGGPKDVLIRAGGPALTPWLGNTVMPDPTLAYYLVGGTDALAENDDWPASLADTIAAVGAFPFTENSHDAAMVRRLEGGGHTFWTRGTTGGQVLVEAYAVDAAPSPRLVNVSARNYTGTGNDVLIAGFVIKGTGNKRVLIRAVGPTLAHYLTGYLPDPVLEVYNGDSVKLVENDDWDGTDAELRATMKGVYAFDLDPGSKDSAVIATLPASPSGLTYSALVRGAGDTTGEALVEVYDVE